MGNFNLPISKSISLNLRGYYKAIKLSEDSSDLTPFIEYMLSIYDNACYLYSLLSNELTDAESKLLCKIDKTGRGTISISKASSILGLNADDTFKVIHSLEVPEVRRYYYVYSEVYGY